MIHDLIAVKKSDFDEMIENLDTTIIFNGSYWLHAYKSPHMSTSIKFDKYVFENTKEYILGKRPKQGAFSQQSIKSLLQPHAENIYLLETDIRHYFESIRFELVINDVKSCCDFRDSDNLIRIFYFTGTNHLKRGLKASATISEIVGLKIDGIINNTLYQYPENKYTYSRYYDDIIISSNCLDDLRKIKLKIAESLDVGLGLSLNTKKTRICTLQGSKVLGMRFHNKQIFAPKNFNKNVRAIIHEYETSTYNEDSLDDVSNAKRHIGKIIGSIRYLLDSSDNKNDKYESALADYYDELYKWEDIRKALVEAGEEYEDD
jgi:hypothetical protein